MGFGSYDETHGRLLSKPVKVYWEGWETDTYTLQQNGWDLSVDQDHMRMYMRMVVRNKRLGFIGQTNNIPMEYVRYGDFDQPKHIWQMQCMGRDIRVHEHGPISAYANFKAIDAKPQLSFEKVTSLEDLVPFARAPLVRTQALVLPEASVDDLLAEILARQSEAKTEYFKDLVWREGQPAPPPHKFHAQIISLGKAA
jgi:hypothetical protein